MNLLFLVEGEKTEPKVYRAWLQHLFPALAFVVRPEDMTKNTCRIIAGKGYPNMVSTPKQYPGVSRLEACLIDIKRYDNVNHFFICLDSEEDSYTNRLNEIRSRFNSLNLKHCIDSSKTEIHIIVQHCCFETWALGNSEICNEYTSKGSSSALLDFRAYYNTLLDDPENMSCCPVGHAFPTKAKFHERYLKEYLKEFGLSYSKKDPKLISDEKYLNALRKRCQSTQHLSSLKFLLNVLSRIKLL